MPSLTNPQRKWLERADERGLIECRNHDTFSRNAYERVMANLTAKGYVRPYVHGGYEITDAGRNALKGAA